MLLMAHVDTVEESQEHIWFLDSGCSNHMCGTREWFVEFENDFSQSVKLGDDRRMMVEGRGSLRLEINGIITVITSVYYVPGLKNNLFSVGQLQEKGLRIIIEDDVCEIWSKQQRKLIIQSNMTKNRMFMVRAYVKKTKGVETRCLQATTPNDQLWHKRFGHLNTRSLRSLAEKDMVKGLPNIIHDGDEVVCEICMRGKQNRESIPKRSLWKSTRGLQLVHSDICGPITPTSESGKRYIINFIDDYSRKCWSYFLTEKSEAFTTFKEFKAGVERELGQALVCLRTDRGGEFNSKEFEEYCKANGIKRQLTAAYTPQQNGTAERKNRSVMNMTRCMLLERSVPRSFWPEAAQYAVHILNRSPSAAVNEVTPEEKWSNNKPSVDHLRIFGCIAYAMVPYERRIKLDEKSTKCVFFGLSKESKAYRLYDPKTKKILISRDVRFDESNGWDWEAKTEEKELEWEETVENVEPEEEDGEEGEGGEEEEGGEEGEGSGNGEEAEDIAEQEEENTNHGSAQTQNVGGSGRKRQAPVWMKDYISGNAGFIIAEEGEDVFALFIPHEDPSSFEEAEQEEVWRRAMEAEITSIEENKTWELMELPEGATVIGVKWVFKTKLNERGEIEKFKARLVAKGYHQREGVDFHEVFAPVARWDTIRMLIALAAEKGWNVFQLDVKSAFLQGELNEAVYVEQPKGFEIQEEQGKVYKLKKALYGLKQAPRAWYSRIDGYFKKEGFEKCFCEHTLFIKKEEQGVLVVSLYVDDLIYTGNSEAMLAQFKVSMMEEFAMSDLGKMKFFLGVEVIQDEEGIFINQQKYAEETLMKYGMQNCNSVRNPIVPGNKLTKAGAGEEVDATEFKQLVGSLRYLTARRPDLIYSVNLVSRYMERPNEQHLLAAKRILRYVQGTPNYGILYKRGGEQKVVGFVDSDYAGDVDDRKSTSGFVFMMGGGAVSWASKKQPIVTLSTTEAEFVAAAYGACQAVWMRNVIEEIGFKQGEGTILFCDNSSTIKLSKNLVLHGRSKHIHVRYHFLRELVNEGTIQLEYCSTGDQLSDIMTKAVKLETFEKLRGRMGVCAKKK